MILSVELPPVDRKLDVNAGVKNALARCGAVRRARTKAALVALDTMISLGIAKGSMRPRFVVVLTRWYRHRTDFDNSLANVKAYQDGIFDALGANDREVVAGCSVLQRLPKEDMKKHNSVRYSVCETREEMNRLLREYTDNGEC